MHKLPSKRKMQRLAPVVAFEATGLVIALKDIITAKKFRHGSRSLWLALVFIQPIGPWLYFCCGQAKED
jgi:hypothetical protein